MRADEAVPYLVRSRLLDAKDVVRGEIRVTDSSSRNSNLSVHCTTRPGYFIKHEPPGGISSLKFEAGLYRRAETDGAYARLRPFLPRVHLFDPDARILVLELRASARHAKQLAALAADDVPPVAAELATALAACHDLGRSADVSTCAALPEMAPWAFELTCPRPEIFRDVAPLQLELLKTIQRHPLIAARVDELRRGWSSVALMHGDVRWENVLAEPAGRSGAASNLMLIDWECAGLGDPAWDVGSALQAFLAHAIESLPLRGDAGVQAVSEGFCSSLPALREHTGLFWSTYVREAALPREDASSLLHRALSYCALRLMQSSYEWARGRTLIPRFAVATLQLGVNMLQLSHGERAALVGLS